MFGGVPIHKFLQQILAARLAGVNLFFSSFRDETQQRNLMRILAACDGLSCRGLLQVLEDDLNSRERCHCDAVLEMLRAKKEGRARGQYNEGHSPLGLGHRGLCVATTVALLAIVYSILAVIYSSSVLLRRP